MPTSPSGPQRTAVVQASHVPAKLDVRAIRRKTGLSQAMFAGRFGFTVAAGAQLDKAGVKLEDYFRQHGLPG